MDIRTPSAMFAEPGTGRHLRTTKDVWVLSSTAAKLGSNKHVGVDTHVSDQLSLVDRGLVQHELGH